MISPYTIGGVAGWWCASDLSGADGSAVSTWQSRITGRKLTQATGTLQPVLRRRALNGYHAVEFDGVDDYLEGPLNMLANGNTCSVWVVVKMLSVPTNRAIWSAPTASSQVLGLLTHSTVNNAFFFDGTIFESDLTKANCVNWNIIGIGTRVSDRASNISANGVFFQGTTGSAVNTNRTINLGRNPGNTTYVALHGQVAEFLVVDKLMRPDAQKRLGRYFARKYKLPWSS